MLEGRNYLPVANFVAGCAIDDAYTITYSCPISQRELRYLVDIFVMLMLVPQMYPGVINVMHEMHYWGEVCIRSEERLGRLVALPGEFMYKPGQRGILIGIVDELLLVHDQYYSFVFETYKQRHFALEPSDKTHDLLADIVMLIRKMLC